MSQQSPEIHPFDAEDGPSVINYRGTRVAIRPSNPAPLNSQNVPLTKPDRVDLHAELRHIRRIVNGANKRLDRLCNSIGSFNEQLSKTK